MTDAVIGFTAARTAPMLPQNAPPLWIDSFVARMALVAREPSDRDREAFWREVARRTSRADAGPGGRRRGRLD